MTHLLDEDSKEFPGITLSEYVDVETFDKHLSQVNGKLSILYLNIHTIYTKFAELKIILEDIKQHHQISVICLQETHFDEINSSLSFDLNDYQLISDGMYFSNARGLIIYVDNNVNFKHVDISREISDSYETKRCWGTLYIEIKRISTNYKTHIIGNIYDPLT